MSKPLPLVPLFVQQSAFPAPAAGPISVSEGTLHRTVSKALQPPGAEAHPAKKRKASFSPKDGQSAAKQAVNRVALQCNPFLRLPKRACDVLGTLLTPDSMMNFRSASRECSNVHLASGLIARYKLMPAIRKYFHHSQDCVFTRRDKVFSLEELMAFTRQLSAFEKIKPPSYEQLSSFFKEVEARNLIRMFIKIRGQVQLPEFDSLVGNLEIANDLAANLAKAGFIRDWIRIQAVAINNCDQPLDLSKCGLTLLPPEIRYFVACKSLNLSGNHLGTLPKEICKLTLLETLLINNNQLMCLPEEIEELCKLRKLDVSQNQIRFLPEGVSQLHALRVLCANDNELTSLPVRMDELIQLQELMLWGNRFTTIPEEIFRISRLLVLDMSKNAISELPEEIHFLSVLEVLNLSGNRLFILPNQIGLLLHLKILDLSLNRIRSLPQLIGKLARLVILNLQMNALRGLPEEISQLNETCQVVLEGNALVELPESLKMHRACLSKQKIKLQIEVFLHRLLGCIHGKHDQKTLCLYMDQFEACCGIGPRKQLETCFYDICLRASSSNPVLAQKLKEPNFGKMGFIDPMIDPKLKLAAIHLFESTKLNKKQK